MRTKTYHATLWGDRLEWNGSGPPPLPPDQPVPVEVTIPINEPLTDADRGRIMADILAGIAARGGVATIPDPVAWQREQRRDRPLPGREE